MDSSETISPKPLFTLRRFNNALSVAIIFFALYIGISPFMQQVTWYAQTSAPVISSPPEVTVPPENIPADNTLVIPRLGLREQVFEGETPQALNNGVWRRPQTSKPDLNSNTVMVGHRFTYRGNGVFYHLDKVQKDDQIVVYWEGKKYEYKVNNIKVVKPTEISVEQPSPIPILSLYTCTPLVTAENRLVIQAGLVAEES